MREISIHELYCIVYAVPMFRYDHGVVEVLFGLYQVFP